VSLWGKALLLRLFGEALPCGEVQPILQVCISCELSGAEGAPSTAQLGAGSVEGSQAHDKK